jgi:hypothetical protein
MSARPRWVVATLRPGQRRHGLIHQSLHHLQTRADRESEQSFSHRAGKISHRNAHPVGYHDLADIAARVVFVW